MATYSFKDCACFLEGPNGGFQVGRLGIAEEGITIERAEDRNTMTPGADGEIMHSLHMARHGTIRIRLLKTSVANGQLQDIFKQQSLSGANWGRNTISVRDFVRGDKIVCSEVAFTGETALTYGKVGNINEWIFHVGHIDEILDQGAPPPVIP